MKAFSILYEQLEQANNEDQKVYYLTQYLKSSDDKSVLSLLAILTGNMPKRSFSAAQLENIAITFIQHSKWIYDISTEMITDIAERIALMLPHLKSNHEKSIVSVLDEINCLKSLSEEEKIKTIENAWQQFNAEEKYIYNRLLLGNLKVNVSINTVRKALVLQTHLDIHLIEYQLKQPWHSTIESLDEYWNQSKHLFPKFKPFDFIATQKFKQESDSAIEVSNYYVEEFWEGIRCQLIKQNDQWMLWSNKIEWLTSKVPELVEPFNQLPNGTIVEGILMSINEGKPTSKKQLRARLNRKTISKKQISDMPFSFVLYDVLMMNGKDIRNTPLKKRRVVLEDLYAKISHYKILISTVHQCKDWNNVYQLQQQARQNQAQGILLKGIDSKYQNKTSDWLLLSAKRYRVRAVLLYVNYGAGDGNMGFALEATFAVRKGEELVTFVKTSNGISLEERKAINDFVKQNTVEKFGPVRTVKPERFYELSFSEIYPSKRHKSGLILKDPKVEQALDCSLADLDTLAFLHELLKS